MLPQVSAFIAMSLDGFIAPKDRSMDWLKIVETENEDYGYRQFMVSIDAVLIGRNTYDLAKSFPNWPFTGKEVIVLTHRKIDPIKNECAMSGSLHSILKSLAQQGKKRIYLDGGKAIQAGLREGVVSDLTISMIPILLGDGLPLFGELSSQRKLKLRTAKSYPSGLVQIHYDI